MIEDDITKMTFDHELWSFVEDDEAQYWHAKFVDEATGYGWVILDKDTSVYQWEWLCQTEVDGKGCRRTVHGLCDTREEAMEIVLCGILNMLEYWK